MFQSVREQMRAIAMIGVASALVVGGVAAAQGSSESGSNSESGSQGKKEFNVHFAGPPGVEVRVEGGPAPATADHGRVLQVVSNLLDKAILVSSAGGAVTVAAGPGELRVSDRGPGIPEAELPHAFERFHLRARTGNGSPEGAGLGLAIVRELSEAMGGTARVENLPSGGALFTVLLPT